MLGIRFGIVLLFIIVAGVLTWFFAPSSWLQPKLISPLSGLRYVQLNDTVDTSKKYRVLGFLPYWTMREATISSELTDIAYFSITLNQDGSLRESLKGERDMGLLRMQEPRFTTWLQERHDQGQKVHITVTMFNTDEISTLMSSPEARQKAIHSLIQLMASYPFDGIQLDVEYAGTVTDGLRVNYVNFTRELREELDKFDPRTELSVAMFGSAASRYTFWDPVALEPHVDFIIVMAYDYHIRSSPVVGPVAPIFGRGAGRWQHDVVSNMRDLLLVVPADKLVLGIPFYGYEWTATSEQVGATTFPDSGRTATYRRVAEILSDPELEAKERWDDDALSPYVTYQENGQTQFIYYENSRSLSYKMDFVMQLELPGIAIWALGYEGGRPELWEVIGRKLNPIN